MSDRIRGIMSDIAWLLLTIALLAGLLWGAWWGLSVYSAHYHPDPCVETMDCPEQLP